MVYKSIGHRKLSDFYNNMGKVRAKLALFSVEKARALHHLRHFYCVHSFIAMDQLARENFDNCFKVITEVLEMQLRIKISEKKSNDVSMTPCHHFQIHENDEMVSSKRHSTFLSLIIFNSQLF